MGLLLHEDEDGIWFQHPSPRRQIQEEWTQGGPEEREGMKKYCMVMEPDIPFHNVGGGVRRQREQELSP